MADEAIDERIERLTRELAEANAEKFGETLIYPGTKVYVECVIVDVDAMDKHYPYQIGIETLRNSCETTWVSSAHVKAAE